MEALLIFNHSVYVDIKIIRRGILNRTFQTSQIVCLFFRFVSLMATHILLKVNNQRGWRFDYRIAC
jgi:hypothetical protein